jgi:hypothetical protein
MVGWAGGCNSSLVKELTHYGKCRKEPRTWWVLRHGLSNGKRHAQLELTTSGVCTGHVNRTVAGEFGGGRRSGGTRVVLRKWIDTRISTVARMGRWEIHIKYQSKRINHMRHLGADWIIILKCIIKEHVGRWAEFICLRTYANAVP